MAKTRVFTGFDYDHDEDLRNLLVGQAKLSDSPFELADWLCDAAEGRHEFVEVVRSTVGECGGLA